MRLKLMIFNTVLFILIMIAICYADEPYLRIYSSDEDITATDNVLTFDNVDGTIEWSFDSGGTTFVFDKETTIEFEGAIYKPTVVLDELRFVRQRETELDNEWWK